MRGPRRLSTTTVYSMLVFIAEKPTIKCGGNQPRRDDPGNREQPDPAVQLGEAGVRAQPGADHQRVRHVVRDGVADAVDQGAVELDDGL